MRTTIIRNDANLVDHLDRNGYVAGSLKNLVVIVVSTRKHGRPGSSPQNATHRQSLILRTVVDMLPAVFIAGSLFGLRLRLQGRCAPVRRIHNERSSTASDG